VTTEDIALSSVSERRQRLQAIFEEVAEDLLFLDTLARGSGPELTEDEPYYRLLVQVQTEVARQLAATICEQATGQLVTLTSGLAEVREGQHELLHMYEELRELYPQRCLCASGRERAQRELAALDPFTPEPNHEDYVPGGDAW
jgi:hypothetical protein